MTTPEKPSRPPIPELPLPGSPANFADIVQRLEDLVKFTLECEKKELRSDVNFIDVYKQLTLIKAGVELLNEHYLARLEGFAEQGLIPKEVPMNPEDQKQYDKLDKLKKVCEEAKARIYDSLQQNPIQVQQLAEEIKDAQSTDKQKIRRRKSKFKGMGGGRV